MGIIASLPRAEWFALSHSTLKATDIALQFTDMETGQ